MYLNSKTLLLLGPKRLPFILKSEDGSIVEISSKDEKINLFFSAA
jgi:hypothetical protein